MVDVFDFIDDESGDMAIRNGDFVVGESTLQHERDLLLMHKGESKQFPMMGVGLSDYLLNESSDAEFRKAVQKEFEDDGMEVRSIELNDFTDVRIDAGYTSSEQ